ASFSRVTLAGPLLNLVAVPMMAVAQVAGLAVVAFDFWPWAAHIAGLVASTSAVGIVWSARFVDKVPALAWRVPPPAIPLLVVYYGSLLALLFAKRARIRVVAALALFVAFLLVVGLVDPRGAPAVDGVRLTMFDVGQGEALVLESGPSRLQIDAGGVPFGSGGFDIGAPVGGAP